MLKLLIVTTSLFIGSLGDVDISFANTCLSEGASMEITAKYTGSGTVTAVQWYYSGQVSTNMLVIASTCDTSGAVPAGYPAKSRMIFGCNEATKTFTLTLSGLQAEELHKSWGATFSLSASLSPDVAQKPIVVCTKCTCDCNCKKKCTRIVIPSIIFGSLGMINLPVVIGGTVTEHFGQKTALVVDFIGFVCDVISLGLGIGVQVEDCCKDAADCCEDSDCCEVECEKNWIETTAIVFIIIGCLVGIVAVVIFYLVWSGRIGRGNNGITKQDLRPLEETVCKKLLRVLESAYPKILLVKDLIRKVDAEETVVMEQLEELKRKDLIRQLDSGGFVRHFLDVKTGITKQDLRPLEEIVCEKLLRVLESVYPNILSVKDLIRIDFAEESVVMEQLEELRRKDQIKQLDSGGFVRHFLDVKTGGMNGGRGYGGGRGPNSNTVHSGREDKHRGTLSDRANSDGEVSRKDVHVQENRDNFSGRPMPPIPLTDKKGRGLSANYDDDHPMISVATPDRRAGDLGPLDEKPRKKKKKKKKAVNDNDE